MDAFDGLNAEVAQQRARGLVVIVCGAVIERERQQVRRWSLVDPLLRPHVGLGVTLLERRHAKKAGLPRHPGHIQRIRAAKRRRLLGVDRISEVEGKLGEGRMGFRPDADDDAVWLLFAEHARNIVVRRAPEPARVPLSPLGIEVAYADDLGARGANVGIDSFRGKTAGPDDAKPGIWFGEIHECE